jgi:hypothetical protein
MMVVVMKPLNASRKEQKRGIAHVPSPERGFARYFVLTRGREKNKKIKKNLHPHAFASASSVAFFFPTYPWSVSNSISTE